MKRRRLHPRDIALAAAVLASAPLAAAAPAAAPATAVAAAATSAGPPQAPDTAAPAAPATATPDSSTPTPAAAVGTPGPTAATADSAADAEFNSAPVASGDSFTGEGTTDSEQAHKLDLYGFADFTYSRLLIPKSNLWTHANPDTHTFAVGNFNLYMSSDLGDSWRALAEVRFLYLPNGATTADSSGNLHRTDTSVFDYISFDETIHWGGIRIERVYIEHTFSGLFHLQMGQFLTPYGIWNVDHGSPTIIGIKKPFVVANQLFPEQQTGIQLYGSAFLDPFEIGYNLTLSNGRGPVDYQDFNDDKAYGGRVYAKTDVIGSLTVGGSFYRGGYYDRSAKYTLTTVGGQSFVDQAFTTLSKYEELSLAADVKWEYKSWLVQSEAIMNEANFSRGGRPRSTVVEGPQGFQADYRRWGAYGLVGYRIPVVRLMPYAILQHAYSPDSPSIPPATGWEFGLNLRPTPAVVFKLQYTEAHFSSPGAAGYGAYPLRLLASQVAWAF